MKKKSIEVFETLLNSAIRYAKWVLLAAALIVLLTGVYKVDSNEVALVLRFGALTGDSRETQIKGPGLHFSLPNFIDEVVKVPVETVQELTVNTLYGAGNTVGTQVQSNGYVLTGDSNVVRMKIVLKYRVSDPIAYALYVSDAPTTLKGVITAELTSLVTRTAVDDVLTTEKSTLTAQSMKNAQQTLDRIGLGVTLTNIELTNITPPIEATDAFNNATTASVRKQTLIQQAKDYEESAIPAAEAKAQALIDSATAAQSAAVAKATSVAEEFRGLYEQYVRNPAVVKNGVFRTRLGKVLEQSGASIVVPDPGSSGGTRVVLPTP